MPPGGPLAPVTVDCSSRLIPVPPVGCSSRQTLIRLLVPWVISGLPPGPPVIRTSGLASGPVPPR
eukprot:3861216-Amphidinium_carterae.1